MTVSEGQIDAVATTEGLVINGYLYNRPVEMSQYTAHLGSPERTMEPNPPAPFGHRNNQIHLFSSRGLYLTEHHASRKIESVNFVFDVNASKFPLNCPFKGKLKIFGCDIGPGTTENDLQNCSFHRDLPGEFRMEMGRIWAGVSLVGERKPNGKRSKVKHLALVSICFREVAQALEPA